MSASNPRARPTRSTVRLILDWDGTLTKKDTLHLVAAIGYDRNRDRDLLPWDEIVQAYITDCTDFAARYTPVKKYRRTVTEESQWLANLKDVERRSIERTKAAGIFTGVTKQDVVSAAESAVQEGKLQLRSGWEKLMAIARTLHQDDTKQPSTSIISVNWSGTFIRACLATASATSPVSDNNSNLNSIPIFANELPLEAVETIPYTCTSADKLAKFKEVRGADGHLAIYVGDSPTDFDCLVAADVGICVRDDPMGSGQKELKEMLERVGFEVLRLSPVAWEDFERGKRDGSGDSGPRSKQKIWWVADLNEISRFIEGSQ